jgi:hypothetical protein
MRRQWLISRRTCLRGLGVALALPLLETMGWADPPKGTTFKAPVRLGFVFKTCGVLPEKFWPTEAKSFPVTLPPSLEPLRPVISDCLVLDGINSVPKGIVSGEAHWYEICSWLTQATPGAKDRGVIDLGISADQLAARLIGHYTPLPSLELGTRNNVATGTTGMGTNNRYSTTANYRSASEPLPVETNPGNVLRRLFASRGTAGRRSAGPVIDPARFTTAGADDVDIERSLEASMLDRVLGNAKDLRRQVSLGDQRQLDSYLDSVRGLEKRIASIEQREAAETAAALAAKLNKGKKAKPGANEVWSEPIEVKIPAGSMTWSEHVRVMSDLMVLAFQCDLTRVCTLIPSHGSDMRYPELNSPDAHHPLSHHRGDQAKKDEIAKIDRFHVEQFAHLVGTMKTLREGPGTLLDHSAILWGSGLGDGDNHSHDRIAAIVAGKAGGTIRTGRYVPKAAGNQSDLLTGLLARAGVPMEKPFGNGTGMLADLA